jgi:hypothetical protein
MKDNIKEILKALPDFEDLMKLATEISNLMYLKMSIDAEIKVGEAKVFQETSTNPKYLIGGKLPTTSYVNETFKYTGLENELIPTRDRLAKTIAALEEKKLQMDIYKTMIEVWRTLSSNERSATLS